MVNTPTVITRPVLNDMVCDVVKIPEFMEALCFLKAFPRDGSNESIEAFCTRVKLLELNAKWRKAGLEVELDALGTGEYIEVDGIGVQLYGDFINVTYNHPNGNFVNIELNLSNTVGELTLYVFPPDTDSETLNKVFSLRDYWELEFLNRPYNLNDLEMNVDHSTYNYTQRDVIKSIQSARELYAYMFNQS